MANESAKQLAGVTLQLVERASLQGSEVPAYVAVRNWLAEIAQTGELPEVQQQPASLNDEE